MLGSKLSLHPIIFPMPLGKKKVSRCYQIPMIGNFSDDFSKHRKRFYPKVPTIGRTGSMFSKVWKDLFQCSENLRSHFPDLGKKSAVAKSGSTGRVALPFQSVPCVPAGPAIALATADG